MAANTRKPQNAGRQAHRPVRRKVGEQTRGRSERRCQTPVEGAALPVFPEAEEHVGDDHDQRRSFRGLLIHIEQETEHRNCNDSAADTEQAAYPAENGAQGHADNDRFYGRDADFANLPADGDARTGNSARRADFFGATSTLPMTLDFATPDLKEANALLAALA